VARLESKMWKKLRPYLMAAKLDPIRVENPIHPGTPDVNLVNGAWIELKAMAAWPREGNLVAIRHFTPQQRVFLYKRWCAGGRTYLLLEVVQTKEWLLFDGDVAAKIVGRGTANVHRSNARQIAVDPAVIVERLR
jgi:Mesyanzhinovviridae DNA helicase